MVATTPDGIAFLVVGTPRSGTTLAQRLIAEGGGVDIPPETHFMWFLSSRCADGQLPEDERDLWTLVDDYLSWPRVSGIDASVDRVLAVFRRGPRSAIGLFDAIVRAAASQDDDVLGEKTPSHLYWWRPLSRARPALRFVGVVRDPRAVAASGVRVPWGSGDHVLWAWRWREDQMILRRAERELGPDRFCTVRYEDMVSSTEATRDRLSGFLKTDTRPRADGSEGDLFLPWETWKQRATEAIDTDRVDAWRTELTADQSRAIEAMCGALMTEFGYQTCSRPSRTILGPSVIGRLKLTVAIRRRVWKANRLRLSEK